MDQLKSKAVDVVLSIEQIKNFDLTGIKLEISVNFNDVTLESDPILIDDYQQQINTTLIWTINKRDLRKIRTSGQPLRLNCYLIHDNEIREKYGHILIDLRCAQIINTEHNNPTINYKWYKVIGLRNRKRNSIPEVYVALTVREHNDNRDEIVERFDDFVQISPQTTQIPIKYHSDGGFIQIGDNDDNNNNKNYLLEILIKTTKNLELLLPEILIFNRNDNKYYLMFSIFGITVRTSDFDKNLDNINNFNGKTLINLKSSNESLRDFLKDQYLEIGFYSGDDLLGNTRIELANLSNFNQRLILNDCLFKYPSENGRIPIVNNRQPSISLEMILIRLPDQEAGDCVADKHENDQQFVENELESKRNELKQLSVEIMEKNEVLTRLQEEIQQTKQKKFEIYDKSMLVENINRLEERIGDLERLIQQKDEEILKIQNVNSLKKESLHLLDQLENLQRAYGDLQLQSNLFRQLDENTEIS